MDNATTEALKADFDRWADDNGFLTNDAEDLDTALEIYAEEKQLSEEEWYTLTSPS